MIKKLALFIVVFILAISIIGNTEARSYFTDINPNDWFYTYVMNVSDEGFFDKNVNFHPADYVNRAQMSKIAYHLHHKVLGNFALTRYNVGLSDIQPN